jgi:hypothetical protein
MSWSISAFSISQRKKWPREKYFQNWTSFPSPRFPPSTHFPSVSTLYLINPFQRHSLCFPPGSSLSRCAQMSGQCSFDYPGGGEGLSLRLTPSLPDRRLLQKRSRSTTRRGPGETLPSPSPSKGSRSGVGGVAPPPTSRPCVARSDGKSGRWLQV